MKRTGILSRAICFSILFPVALQAREPKPVTVEVVAKSRESWNGRVLPHYGKGSPEITILRIVVPPSVRLPEHKHPVINAGVLLKGQLTVVTDEGEVLQLRAGEPIVEVVETWHYGENRGEEPAELIMFYAGNKGVPLSVEKN